jgi:predicted ATPase
MPIHLKNILLETDKYPCNDQFPFDLPIFQHTKKISFETPVSLFVGENGSGKSTLLEALANVCGIHIWQNTERSRINYNPYEFDLPKYLKAEWTHGKVPGSYFGSEIFTHFTEILDAWATSDPGQLDYFGGRSLTTLSHGQSLMAFFKSRYQIKGLFLLDEPETALSPRTQLELLELIKETSTKGNAQFIIATHSPIILSCPKANILSFDSIPVKSINYKETDHYKIYSDFMRK